MREFLEGLPSPLTRGFRGFALQIYPATALFALAMWLCRANLYIVALLALLCVGSWFLAQRVSLRHIVLSRRTEAPSFWAQHQTIVAALVGAVVSAVLTLALTKLL